MSSIGFEILFSMSSHKTTQQFLFDAVIHYYEVIKLYILS